ncbi:hypothetical protein A2662_00100 [Candidatus Giovannonibacteria bacterium RIFCSPHIGHO2_01_FULL_45_33]|nr:MAG: hypothetical protein A2662_00100 [Candidatus Giovannonibacteria bacterium RIFCSPHIGHO2_01_FULL_45_33]
MAVRRTARLHHQLRPNKVTLDNINIQDYSSFIFPFLRNGIVLDSTVLYELIDGIIRTRIGGESLDNSTDFQQINAVLDLLHLNQNTKKLYVTPHILTETCRYLQTFNYRKDYQTVVKEIFPLIEGMSEYPVSKEPFLKQIDQNKPVIEAGDLSIYVTADNFTNDKQKIAVLTKDGGIKNKLKDLPYVLVIDYRTIAYNLIYYS